MNSNEDDGHIQEYALQLASASVLPMALKAAIELGVFEIIREAGPEAFLSPSQIATKLPVKDNNPDAPFLLDRILRLLVSYSVLNCTVSTSNGQVDRLYGLAPVAKYFIRSQGGGSLATILQLIQDKAMINTWFYLKDAVLEGGLPFTKAYGMTAATYIGNDASLSEVFKTSMTDYNPLFMERVLEIYKGFEGLKSLVDVGGGDGSILHMIISKHPTLRGINYDLPQVIEKSPAFPGVDNVPGDMFVSIPNGDAIFMKWILHTWDDDHCLKILKNCYKALPLNGKVIVVDMVIPEAPEVALSLRSLFQFELFMMNMNPAGNERTEREFERLGKAAGFSNIGVACSAFNFSVVEFYK